MTDHSLDISFVIQNTKYYLIQMLYVIDKNMRVGVEGEGEFWVGGLAPFAVVVLASFAYSFSSEFLKHLRQRLPAIQQ